MDMEKIILEHMGIRKWVDNFVKNTLKNTLLDDNKSKNQTNLKLHGEKLWTK